MLYSFSMSRYKLRDTTLCCFSPPVMIATFVIEALLALYILIRRDLHGTFRWLVFALLACLSLFQLAEYNVCVGPSNSRLLWSRLGYVAITLLPPLGLDLVNRTVAGKKDHWVKVGYIVGAAMAGWFALVPGSIVGAVCSGNYAIFSLSSAFAHWVYGSYYYSLLFAALWVASRKVKGSRARTARWLVISYLSFMVPTAAVNLIKPETQHGVPSIMCGFALIFALILVTKVMPVQQLANSPKVAPKTHTRKRQAAAPALK
jgi:hypothetical protein